MSSATRGLRAGVCVVAVLLGLPAAAAAATAPSFVQQATRQQLVVPATGLGLQPTAAVTAGNRLVVQTETWSSAGATAASVSDTAGNAWTRLLTAKAPDGTEMSVWTAPVTAGGGTRPTVTVKPTGTTSMGTALLEYAGLSPLPGTGVLDRVKTAVGTTTAATTVTSGPTAPLSTGDELVLGFYADSGFGATLTGDAGYTQRLKTAPSAISDLLAQDSVLDAGATPSPGVKTTAGTSWLAATLALRPAAAAAPTAPGAPTDVAATAGSGSATVTWTAPTDGNSPLTGYVVTPYAGGVAGTPTTVTGNPPAATAGVTGLTDGTAYTFRVAATNAVGTGPASVASAAVTPGAGPIGEWGPTVDWPLVSVHTVLLPTGDLLVWDGWSAPQPTDIWNASTQGFAVFMPHASIFCSGQVQMPDGRILVAGGHGGHTTGELGIKDSTIFDPETSTWNRVADMNAPRWYPGLTELPDGRSVAISGNTTDDKHWADTPEVYDPVKDEWTLLTGVTTPQVHEEEYPFTYLLPNGKVLTLGPEEDVTYTLDVDQKRWDPLGGPSGITNGSSVMYRPGKVLYSGGAARIDTAGPARATTAVLDATAPAPNWRSTAPMAASRVYHSLTMLADGRVLAVGGQPASGAAGDITVGVLPTEVWDPQTETWSPGAPISRPRGYHSTAVLMPDGKVLVSGGGHARSNTGPGQNSAQLYWPSYLFAGPRPTITTLPARGTYGATVGLATPDASRVRSVNLVSLAATTHQSDMSQHFVPLTFTAGAGTLDVKLPAEAALAPPANYMVFIVDDKGVPSVASMLRLGPQAAPPPLPTVGPAWVQQASRQQLSVSTTGLALQPTQNVTAGNRIVVQTETWSGAGATTATVTDSASNTYTRVLTRKAPDGTEMSVWTAPVTAGGGTRPTVTVKPTGSTSMGIAVLEYTGLTAAPGTGAVDAVQSAAGLTGSTAATVSSGPTAALSGDALVLGFYADSGFEATLTADPAYTKRISTAPSAISDLLVQERRLGAGATPAPGVGTSPRTDWIAATVAFKVAPPPT